MRLLLALLFAFPAIAQTNVALPIMPLPAQVQPGKGEFSIDTHFGIAIKGYSEPRLEHGLQRFLDILSKETGIPCKGQAKRRRLTSSSKPRAPAQRFNN